MSSSCGQRRYNLLIIWINRAFYNFGVTNYELQISKISFPVFKVSKKYVSKELAKEIHAKAAPFVKWLKEAEEESEGSDAEEEEDDDENVEVISYTF